MAAAADPLERKAGPAAAIPAAAATLAGKRIPAAVATLADNGIPAAAVILAGKRIPADAATMVGAAMTADGAGAAVTVIAAVVALASGTTRHLTRTAPAITISRTIAIPTATTISGATGMLQPLAATPTRTKDINAAR